MYEEFLESVGTYVLRLVRGSIADIWHLVLSLEPTAHPVVDTLGLPPVLLQFLVPVRLVADELLGSFFYTSSLHKRPD